MTPTTANAGWKIKQGAADLSHGVSDANETMRSMEFVWLANFTGCPALSVPVGYVDVDGDGVGGVAVEGKVPVGLMGMGEWGTEDALIEWGKDADSNSMSGQDEGEGDGIRRPPGWVDVVRLASNNRPGVG